MKKFLEIPSQIESIKLVENFIDEMTKDMKLDKSLYGNVLISVIEAVNNSILHGNGGDANKKVKLHFECNDEQLTVHIQDEGDGFNYHNIPDPTSPENLESLNGRGIFLMNQLSDEISFYDNGSKIEMKFKIN